MKEIFEYNKIYLHGPDKDGDYTIGVERGDNFEFNYLNIRALIQLRDSINKELREMD